MKVTGKIKLKYEFSTEIKTAVEKALGDGSFNTGPPDPLSHITPKPIEIDGSCDDIASIDEMAATIKRHLRQFEWAKIDAGPYRVSIWAAQKGGWIRDSGEKA